MRMGAFTFDAYPYWEYAGPVQIGETVPEINFKQVGVNCQAGSQGDHLFAEVYTDYGQGSYWLKNLNQGWNFNYTPPTGPDPSTNSAEQVLEVVNGDKGYGSYLNASTTFYGAGVTDTKHNPNYIAYSTAQHDYESVYHGGSTYPTDVVLNPGPIVNDPGDPPYDQYLSLIHI